MERTSLRRLICSCFLVAVCFGTPAPLHSQFYSYETRDFRVIYYSPTHSYVLPHLRRCFENSFTFHRRILNYTPSQPVTVLFQDFDDYGYAGATSLPQNYMILGIEPYENMYETCPTNERLNWVMSHELMHVVSTDKASPADNFYQTVFFGKVSPTSEDPVSMFYSYLTTPRKYSPRWYLEGIAVFMETWMAGGIGRAQGAYDEMVFRSMVRDSSFFYDVVGLESEGTTVDFQIGQNSYLYGTRFVSYLAYQYSPQKVLEWIDRPPESDADFASQFRRVFGTSLDDEWSKWIRWEHQWQQANLDSIRAYPLTQYRQVSREAVGAVSREYYDSSSHQIYVAVNYPGQLAKICAIDIRTGTVRKIADMPTPAMYYVCHLAYDPAHGVLFYTTKNNKGRRDLACVDLSTGKASRLLDECRVGDLAFNRADQSIWGIQHNDGYSILVKIPKPYNGWIPILDLPYGRDLFDTDISPDGKYLTATLMEISGQQKLIRVALDTLMAGRSNFEVLYEFGDRAPMNFVYSPDGRYLYGSTYFTGAANVVRYDFQKKDMEWISNAETGFFRPVPVGGDSVLAFRYCGKGFVPVVFSDSVRTTLGNTTYLGYGIRQRYPVVDSWTLPSPLTVNIDSLTTYSGEYNGFGRIGLISAYPVVEGYKEFAAFGARVNMMDPLMLHDLDLVASYTPNSLLPRKERFHASAAYSYWGWKLDASYNRSDFYDLFGPTKTSRKGYSLGIQYTNMLLTDYPATMDYTLTVTGWGGLETLPDFQNVAASYDKYLTANGKLSYRYLQRSLGGIEAESGVRGQLFLMDNLVRRQNFPRVYATADYGVLLPLAHSSLWLRGALGYSHGDREEPFANFYFGGFGNNWVDYQDAKRYRQYYSFPGVEIDEVGGTDFGKLMLEWALPPVMFRRLGFMNLYCNWAHLTLFTSALGTNLGSSQDRRELWNVGSQVDFKLVLLSRLESTLSVGYALAMEKDQPWKREFMVSLKIL